MNGLLLNIEEDKRLHKADYGTLSWLKEWKMVNFKLGETNVEIKWSACHKRVGQRQILSLQQDLNAKENSWRATPYT